MYRKKRRDGVDGEDGEMGVMRWIDNDGKLFSAKETKEVR